MIYVDDAYVPLGRMKCCHMIADTSEELDAMADKIGMKRGWKQYAGTYKEHYDVSKSRRSLAVSFGVTEVTQRQLAVILREKLQREREHE